MGRSRLSVAARQQLLLWAAVVTVALSVLALHQLSLNHTAADPGTGEALVAEAAHVPLPVVGDGVMTGHAHFAEAVDQVPWSGDGGCAGCGDHHAAVLTCLAALLVVTIGVTLSGPIEWRGIRLRFLQRWKVLERPRREPLPLSLAELSISRT